MDARQAKHRHYDLQNCVYVLPFLKSEVFDEKGLPLEQGFFGRHFFHLRSELGLSSWFWRNILFIPFQI
jgi:hypothetical protein